MINLLPDRMIEDLLKAIQRNKAHTLPGWWRCLVAINQVYGNSSATAMATQLIPSDAD